MAGNQPNDENVLRKHCRLGLDIEEWLFMFFPKNSSLMGVKTLKKKNPHNIPRIKKWQKKQEQQQNFRI